MLHGFFGSVYNFLHLKISYYSPITSVRFPDTFAAAVPICGTVNPVRLADAANVRFRIFHGDADNVVPVEGSREAYRALKNLGAEVEYIEFPGCNHGSWNPAFNYPGFMEWIFAQRKR